MRLFNMILEIFMLKLNDSQMYFDNVVIKKKLKL